MHLTTTEVGINRISSRRATALVCLLLAYGSVSATPAWIERSWLGFGSSKAASEGGVGMGQIIEKAFGDAPARLDLALPPGVPITALASDAGAIYFVTGVDWTNNGSTISPRDVAVIDADGQTSIAFSGATLGIPHGNKIDALSVRGGEILLSVATGSVIGGQPVSRSDVLAWDGAMLSIAVSAGATGIPATANLVALDRTATGSLLMGFDVGSEIGGMATMPGDILEFFPESGAWRKARKRDRLGLSCMPCDLQSLSVESSSNTIFRSGIEEFE